MSAVFISACSKSPEFPSVPPKDPCDIWSQIRFSYIGLDGNPELYEGFDSLPLFNFDGEFIDAFGVLRDDIPIYLIVWDESNVCQIANEELIISTPTGEHIDTIVPIVNTCNAFCYLDTIFSKNLFVKKDGEARIGISNIE